MFPGKQFAETSVALAQAASVYEKVASSLARMTGFFAPDGSQMSIGPRFT
jgi:hypothetical protein